MSQVASTDELVTKTDLATFYQGILPYLGGMPEIVANKFTKSDLYSTDEKIIGQWTDGKPLYQRVIVLETTKNIAATTWTTVLDVSSDNIDKYAHVWCRTNADVVMTGMLCKLNGTNLQLYSPIAVQSIKEIIVQYTKTTDSAIKIGNETDYSEDEQIIGTWIDGKPIYQKTVHFGYGASSGQKNVAHGISNADKWISIQGAGQYQITSGWNVPNAMVFIKADATNIVMIFSEDHSSVDYYVTLQYTKTTD